MDDFDIKLLQAFNGELGALVSARPNWAGSNRWGGNGFGLCMQAKHWHPA